MNSVIYKLFGFFIVTQILVFCAQPNTIEKRVLLHKVLIDNEDTSAGSPKYTENPHSGKFFSHTDTLNVYGSGNLFQIPDSVLNNDIRVKVNMWVRQGDFNEQNQMAISLEDASGIIQWASISTKKYVKETKKWINVIDSVLFPAKMINKSGLVIKTFSYNPETTSYFDVDDAEVCIYKVDKNSDK